MDKQRSSHQTYERNKYKIYKSNKKLPINLHKKALREKRKRNEHKKQKKRVRKLKKDFKDHEHEALINSTLKELKHILASNDILSDIPCDITPEELLGEIALAEGNGMIVYVKRDGLTDLTVVLPQEMPTIANLKRAIETTANTQLRRELQQRYEERFQRRARAQPSDTMITSCSEENAKQHKTKSQMKKSTAGISMKSQIRSTGELVCSASRNGHQHRATVSWRFLWRAYMLYHMDTNKPIDDSNGRRLLSECGIENATTLKFCKRENYSGRKRQ